MAEAEFQSTSHCCRLGSAITRHDHLTLPNPHHQRTSDSSSWLDPSPYSQPEPSPQNCRISVHIQIAIVATSARAYAIPHSTRTEHGIKPPPLSLVTPTPPRLSLASFPALLHLTRLQRLLLSHATVLTYVLGETRCQDVVVTLVVTLAPAASSRQSL